MGQVDKRIGQTGVLAHQQNVLRLRRHVHRHAGGASVVVQLTDADGDPFVFKLRDVRLHIRLRVLRNVVIHRVAVDKVEHAPAVGRRDGRGAERDGDQRKYDRQRHLLYHDRLILFLSLCCAQRALHERRRGVNAVRFPAQPFGKLPSRHASTSSPSAFFSSALARRSLVDTVLTGRCSVSAISPSFMSRS